MKLLDLDESSLKKLALKVAESESASVCLINRHGSVICAAGKSGGSAKALLEKVLKELGGSGGGSDRIAQGRAKKVSIVTL